LKLYLTVAKCYEQAGEYEHALQCVTRAHNKVADIERFEQVDPPVPLETVGRVV
jgi:hypothetical protein